MDAVLEISINEIDSRNVTPFADMVKILFDVIDADGKPSEDVGKCMIFFYIEKKGLKEIENIIKGCDIKTFEIRGDEFILCEKIIRKRGKLVFWTNCGQNLVDGDLDADEIENEITLM